jgi:hypothetical protein
LREFPFHRISRLFIVSFLLTLARIAAVHLQIPDLANHAVCAAPAAEDMLIKYASDEGAGAANWNPALHPRTGTPGTIQRDRGSRRAWVIESRRRSGRIVVILPAGTTL